MECRLDPPSGMFWSEVFPEDRICPEGWPSTSGQDVGRRGIVDLLRICQCVRKERKRIHTMNLTETLFEPTRMLSRAVSRFKRHCAPAFERLPLALHCLERWRRSLVSLRLRPAPRPIVFPKCATQDMSCSVTSVRIRRNRGR